MAIPCRTVSRKFRTGKLKIYLQETVQTRSESVSIIDACQLLLSVSIHVIASNE
jgi:hypothetical protein